MAEVAFGDRYGGVARVSARWHRSHRTGGCRGHAYETDVAVVQRPLLPGFTT